VEDLTAVELRSRQLTVGHLEVYRAAAPGFANAFLMLGGPQIGVRHSRRLNGLAKVTREQWDTGLVWDDEIGVSTSLSPKFPNISVPYGALIPAELDNILDNIGLPYSYINFIYNRSGLIGSADADILVSLHEKHQPVEQYAQRLRSKLSREFPGTTFYFLPADMISQILNFGSPAPIG